MRADRAIKEFKFAEFIDARLVFIQSRDIYSADQNLMSAHRFKLLMPINQTTPNLRRLLRSVTDALRFLVTRTEPI